MHFNGRHRLYLFLLLGCAAGYLRLLLLYRQPVGDPAPVEVGFCMIKEVTDFPCPACGTTRSALSLLDGHWADALYWNPLGYLAVLVLLLLPPLMLYDLLTGRMLVAGLYDRFIAFINHRPVAVVAIALVVVNWLWNIFKGL